MSKNKKYVVRLTEEERAHLRTLIVRGSESARTLSRARILLKANEGEGGAGCSEMRPSPRRWRWGALHRRAGATAVRERGVGGGLEAQGS